MQLGPTEGEEADQSDATSLHLKGRTPLPPSLFSGEVIELTEKENRNGTVRKSGKLSEEATVTAAVTCWQR